MSKKVFTTQQYLFCSLKFVRSLAVIEDDDLEDYAYSIHEFLRICGPYFEGKTKEEILAIGPNFKFNEEWFVEID